MDIANGTQRRESRLVQLASRERPKSSPLKEEYSFYCGMLYTGYTIRARARLSLKSFAHGGIVVATSSNYRTKHTSVGLPLTGTRSLLRICCGRRLPPRALIVRRLVFAQNIKGVIRVPQIRWCHRKSRCCSTALRHAMMRYAEVVSCVLCSSDRNVPLRALLDAWGRRAT